MQLKSKKKKVNNIEKKKINYKISKYLNIFI
jgi:hypothetical protein